MDKPGFLKSTCVQAVDRAFPSSAIQQFAPELFKLHYLAADGIHNDAHAINALLNGETVIAPDGKALRGEMIRGIFTVQLPAGNFNVGTHFSIIGRGLHRSKLTTPSALQLR